jgi:rod shape-determining protein MreD
LISIAFILLKGGMENYTILKSIDVDIIIVLIAYLLAFHGEIGAGIFAFGQGFIMDIFSGGIPGLFTLLYLVAFMCLRLASGPLNLYSTGGQISIVSLIVLLKKCLMIGLLYLFSMEIAFSVSDFLLFVVSMICSGLIAPFLFYFLDLLDNLFLGHDEDFESKLLLMILRNEAPHRKR